MSYIRDRFIKSLDNSPTGVIAAVNKVDCTLKDLDYRTWLHLDKLNIDPKYYSFRWLTLLLSQELILPDLLRLWDSLFADENKFDLFDYVCVAIIIQIRDKILNGSFTDCIQLLQHLPPDTDVIKLLQLALKLRSMHNKNDIKSKIKNKTKEKLQQYKKKLQKPKTKVKNAMNFLASSIDNYLSQ